MLLFLDSLDLVVEPLCWMMYGVQEMNFNLLTVVIVVWVCITVITMKMLVLLVKVKSLHQLQHYYVYSRTDTSSCCIFISLCVTIRVSPTDSHIVDCCIHFYYHYLSLCPWHPTLWMLCRYWHSYWYKETHTNALTEAQVTQKSYACLHRKIN